jgi:hypothetical protein
MDQPEAIQQLILNVLDQHPIEDTNVLKLDGHSLDQQLVLGVLKRLESHEVRNRKRCQDFFVDGQI